MIHPEPAAPRWKRMAALTLWLWLALPVGLLMLYQDKTLSAPAKWRLLVYACLVPMLLYITVSVCLTSSSLQTLLP